MLCLEGLKYLLIHLRKDYEMIAQCVDEGMPSNSLTCKEEHLDETDPKVQSKKKKLKKKEKKVTSYKGLIQDC